MLKKTRTVNLQKQSLGKKGEDFATALLIKQGYKIVTRNFGTKLAEIDIIAIDGDTLVFVEVKTRRNLRMGLPVEAVKKNKLSKIKTVGEAFATTRPNLPKKLRVDVISLVGGSDGKFEWQIIKVDPTN